MTIFTIPEKKFHTKYTTEKQLAALAAVEPPFDPELVAKIQEDAINKHDLRVLADRESECTYL